MILLCQSVGFWQKALSSFISRFRALREFFAYLFKGENPNMVRICVSRENCQQGGSVESICVNGRQIATRIPLRLVDQFTLSWSF